MTKSDHTITQATADYDDDDVFSAISCLPDDVVLEIFKKLMDLKMLCVCEAVSKRFYAVIRQVDTVSHTSPFSSIEKLVECGWLKSMSNFERVKSVCIQIPSHDNSNYDGYFFKWKVKTGFNGIYSFVFLLATSVYDKNNGLLLYEEKQKVKKTSIAVSCLVDARLKVNMLKHITNDMPLLEKVSITDPDNRGKVSVNGREKIDEFRNLNSMSCYRRVSVCLPPLLELPVSGYVMEGVALVLVENNDHPHAENYDSFFLNDEIDIKHDKEEAAYHEAMMEIFKKHKGSIVSNIA